MKDCSVTDIIQVFFTLIGGGWGIYLLIQNNNAKRKEFILEIYNALHNDKEIVEIIYSVDRNENTKEIRHRGKLEKQADKTLRYFDFIGQLIKDKDLLPEDIRAFKYEIKRVLNNTDIKEYIIWLKKIHLNLDNLKYLDNIK